MQADDSLIFGEGLPPELDGFLEALPPEIAELLPKELFSDSRDEVSSAVRQMGSFSFLLNTVLAFLGIHTKDAFRLLAGILGLLLLSSLLSALCSSFSNRELGDGLSLLSSLAILASVLSLGGSPGGIGSYFSTLNRLSAASIPLLAVLYTLGGNITAAAASTAGLSVYLTVLEELVGKSILPFVGICQAFSLMNAVDSELRTETLLSTLKKQYTTFLTFLMMLLLAMLGTQTTLSARADSLAMRSVKFAAGALIPVVGGSVSELLRTVSAGIGYLRGTVGMCGVLLVLIFLFSPLTELFLFRLVFQLLASAADLLGCSSEKKLLDGLASLNGYLIAAVSICSSALLLSFLLLIHCGSAIA